MPVSVVETVQGTAGSSGSTPTATLASTPAPGDVVYVTLTYAVIGRNITGITGLGATWSEVAKYNTVSGVSQIVWQGVGATAAGLVTATVDASGNGSLRAFLVRGLTSTAAVVASVTGSSTAALSGPASLAARGQLVLLLGQASIKTTGNLLQGDLPAAGWQVQSPPAAATGNHQTAYRIPTEDAGGGNLPTTTHQGSISTGSSATKAITALVLGTPEPVAGSPGFWGMLL